MGIFSIFGNTPERRLGKYFDEVVEHACKSSGGNPMIAGVITYSAIAKTYDSLKHNISLMNQFGISEIEYQRLLEKVLNSKGREYISNWDQMRRAPHDNNLDY